jgi:hypothetical protein
MKTKVCAKCFKRKLAKYFNKCKRASGGLHNHCRNCQKIVRREWYLKNQDKEAAKSREYAKTDKAKQQRKLYYLKNKDKLLSLNRKLRATPHARQLANTARKKMLETNQSFKIGQNLRGRIRIALKKKFVDKIRGEHTKDLLGCSFEELKLYLESKFQDGMSWDNYGVKGWHIDHIIPCDSFDLTKSEERRKCFHYSNLQPLWWYDNLSKGNKIDE